MKAIIVDDEQQSHEVLKNILAKHHPGIEIAASGYNVAEGLQIIKAHAPDLIFLDIDMPDGNGFDLLEKIGEPSFHVIFITAHNEFAVSAIRFGALDYILKPPDVEELSAALDRARKVVSKQNGKEQWKLSTQSYQDFKADRLPTRMIVSNMDGMHIIPIVDIIRLEADRNSTEIFYSGATKRLIAALNIGAYEEQFKQHQQFMRVHRAHIVNLMRVTKYIKGDSFLIMEDGTNVPVSRSNHDGLLGRLAEL